MNDFISCIPRSPFAKNGFWGISTNLTITVAAQILLMTLDNEIIAFEAKLEKWREALHQAYRNSCFAHYSYIVVPEIVAEKAIQYEIEFAQRSVGVCDLSNGRIVIARHADRSIPFKTGY